MNGILKAIIISLTVSSLFSCVILSLVPNGVIKEITKFAVGLFIANSMLIPFTKIKFSSELLFFPKNNNIQIEIEKAAKQTKDILKETFENDIGNEISSKLLQFGYTHNYIKVNILINESNKVFIQNITIQTGSENKNKISEFLNTNYGINKENIKYVEN